MTGEIIHFSADPDADDLARMAPAWMGAIVAVDYDRELIDQAVVLVAADAESEAQDKALNLALRKWPLVEGWEGHHATVSHLETALNKWLGVEGRWISV